jgi:hypothetical protein
MNNNSENISRYIQNEMSVGERAAFEKQLAADKDLQQEFSIQQQIIKAASTAGLKNEFTKAIKKKIFNQRLLQWGIVATILTAAFVFYAIKTNLFSRHSINEKIKTEATQQFIISNAADTIIETRNGVVFAIPAHAFNSESNNIRLEIKTALNAYDIMRQGLSTTSNEALLQTAGMFYLNGYDGDKPLTLVKNINVSVPANEINPAMQLFDGVQDSSGNINWVNPKPIENKLRTYDIITLDFYPPNYIPTLKTLKKEYSNKRYTDSLYYSFSGYLRTEGPMNYEINSADLMTNDSDPESSDTNIVIDNKKGYRKTDTVKKKFDLSEGLSKKDTTTKMLRDSLNLDTYGYEYEINPARIGAIWNSTFNNTILATKEFEERLHYMHSLCTAEYFKLYVANLNKPIFEIDQFCAKNSSGDVRKKFLEFAARKDGRVMIKDGMQAKLSEFFQIKYKAYQQAAAETWAKHEAELARLNAIADEKQKEQAISDFKRNSSNYEEELCANLSEAYRQAGIEYSCNDTIVPAPPARTYYNVTIPATGWYNLDVFVKQVTADRQTGTYTDSTTGKTITLTYKEINISIENMAAYDKVFVYLLPDGLNSFQRVKQKGNVFEESLNSLFKYDAVAIAYKGTETFFFKQSSIQPGQYSFTLSPIPENELKDVLKNYSVTKSADLNTEIEYRLFEQQEVIRQVQVRKDWEFRQQVAAAIFKCEAERPFPVKDSTRKK